MRHLGRERREKSRKERWMYICSVMTPSYFLQFSAPSPSPAFLTLKKVNAVMGCLNRGTSRGIQKSRTSSSSARYGASSSSSSISSSWWSSPSSAWWESMCCCGGWCGGWQRVVDQGLIVFVRHVDEVYYVLILLMHLSLGVGV